MFENFETKHLQIKAEKALTGREALGSALGTEELVHLQREAEAQAESAI